MLTRAEFTRSLLAERWLIPSGVPGVFGRGPQYSRVVSGIEAAIDTISAPEGAKKVSFPPLIPRELLRRVGYVDNFPHLCGSVHAFAGKERDHAAFAQSVKNGADWSPHLKPTDLVLLPAACYPLYPMLTGSLPEGGERYDFTGYCFRNEPSEDPARMQYFQVREKVCAGTPEEVRAWRSGWIERGLELLRALGLSVNSNIATDPFFGRGGRLMKATQAEQELKFELLIPIWPEEEPTAVASFNYHQEHFGEAFAILTAGGACAHTACVGFGIDRIAIALLKTHGLNLSSWPAAARGRMGW
jgi:seryl-tRNA synthetase